MTTTWVALLRGVNVNGITIRSADLAELFRTELAFDAVRTVLASGNVRFEADAAASARAELKARIEKALGDRFGYDAWIVLVTLAELQAAIDGFPFDADDAERQPYVVFASDRAAITELTGASADFDADVDPVRASGDVLYWNPVKGTTVDTPFGKLLGKAAFKRTTTNRNLRTLVKIAG
jgi:uncharacterized protein (DUF1697 family)